jgi:hypothetical protein
MELYTTENVQALVSKVLKGNLQVADYLTHYYDKIKKELQVHTKGKLFDKVINVFQNEEPEASKYVINTYESITKGSVWRGIDNLNRVFNNTGFNVTGDSEAIKSLGSINFFSEYINNFINISTATDPNTVQVWLRNSGGKWVSSFVETQFIKLINDNEIAFIVPEESDYDIQLDTTNVANSVRLYNQNKLITQSFFEGVSYSFKKRTTHVYINRYQYVRMYTEDGQNVDTVIYTFDKPLLTPYSFTGVEEVARGVHHSVIAGFIPFANHALIQHRTYRSVEAIFGYPRMSEVELPCDHCVQGMETCAPCDEHPDGLKTCTKCGGSGYLSLQSPFKIYKRKLFPDVPELNANMKPVEFFTPDIGILEYNSKAWKDSLQMAEDAIYIQQRVETGNVESAKSREKQLESMYAWLGRVSKVVYGNIQNAITNYTILNGYKQVSVEQPLSFAIMNELEAFDYLNQIVSVDAPVFIKTTHVENFLNKYVSKSNPIIKIVDILKRIDPFIFYTQKDLQALSDSGIINDKDWKVHSYAFPLLMNLYSINPQFIEKEYKDIEQVLIAAIERKTGKMDDVRQALTEGMSSVGSASASNELKGSVGGLTGMIEIVKAVSSGIYELEAAVALVADRFGVTEEEARKQLGNPPILKTSQEADDVAKLV